MKIKYFLNKASELEIIDHLKRVNYDFATPLQDYVDIPKYARKLAKSAIRVESFKGVNLVGLLAIYYNSEKQFIFGSNFSIEKEYRGEGMQLFNVLLRSVSNSKDKTAISPEMRQVRSHFLHLLEKASMPEKLVVKSIHTEVHHTNRRLILYYKRLGFNELKPINESIYLVKDL